MACNKPSNPRSPYCLIPLSVNWRKRQNAFTANTVTISSLERGRFDMPYGRDSTQRNLRKPENWANRRAPIRSKKSHTWARMTPHTSTDWEQTAALLERSCRLLLWVQDECESSQGTTTITEPNSSQQQRPEQGSKEKLQPGRFKLAWLFPQGVGSAAVE